MYDRTLRAIEATELTSLQLTTIIETIDTFIRIGKDNPELLPHLLDVVKSGVNVAIKVNRMNSEELRHLGNMIDQLGSQNPN